MKCMLQGIGGGVGGRGVGAEQMVSDHANWYGLQGGELDEGAASLRIAWSIIQQGFQGLDKPGCHLARPHRPLRDPRMLFPHMPITSPQRGGGGGGRGQKHP